MKSKISLSILALFAACLNIAQGGVFFSEGKTKDKSICITIDDGPTKNTYKLFELLDKHGVKATFFVLGANAEKFPDSVKEMLKLGHEIGSHLYHHTNYYKYKEPDIKENISRAIKKADDSLFNLTGLKVKLLRMPHGYAKRPAVEAARENGMFLINWSFGYDWNKIPKDEMVQKYINALKPGAVLLFHDSSSNHEFRLEVLEEVLIHAKQEGYSFITVSEMFGLNSKKF